MDTEKMCKLFREADSYFNGKDVDTTKFNEHKTIKSYCRDDGGCKTNEERINALIAYIIMDFKRSIEKNEYNDYDEYLLMWISDKLFNMHKEGKGKHIKKGYMDTFTLKQAYEEYLEKHKGIFGYWYLLDMIKDLKEAYLKYMSEFYKLLNNICITIKEYNDKGAKSSQLSKYSKNCLNQYRILYMNIYECKSYLHLLNKLKGIYDDFRVSAIKETSSNNNLETILQKLTLGNGTELEAVRSFKTYDFSGSECKLPKKKNPKPKKTGSPPLQPTKLESTSSSLPLTPSPEMQKQDSLSPSQLPEQSKDQLSDQTDSDGGQDAINIVPAAAFLGMNLNAATYLVNATTSFETINTTITEVTDTIKNLYSTALTNLKTTYGTYSSFLKEMIDNISTDSKQVKPPSESGGGGDGPSQPKKDSEQTSSETSPSSTEENKTDQSSREPSENHNSDQNGQGGEKPVEVPVIKPEDSGTETKGNGTIGIGDIFIFKEFKKIGIPIIVIIISITLAIMYKFLVFERRKKLKRKKMKKVPNLFGVNKTT
ncbi:CIR protein [Plasmodium chabaudi chabaudi]|uniref:CIR protein n=1 Tax=Plasmodium chabaudi chabaudi TaxID=31271 RepID=A0A4V0K5X8_PLACU|nr:CIR protein [Plasmodium chabaudi chabaudi]VTZ67873.1 CIR protein [Plasmodium chabaudi chabaudi]|eukprot:XP_016653503.1 CIR protein [Plasmodium chabaudi chabaudi]